MKFSFTIVALICCAGFSYSQSQHRDRQAQAADSAFKPAGRLWASTFVDYSYIAESRSAPLVGTNSFTFRRIYLGYDQEISGHFAARVLLQSDNADTSLNGAMSFYVKHAYLEWKELVPSSSIYFGLSQTPSIALSEQIWAYRSIEKVILDRKALVQTSDMGVGMRGRFSEEGSSGYALMVGNGQGVKEETDKLKRIYAEYHVAPLKGSTFELYSDFENSPFSGQRITGKALLGFQSVTASVGAEGFYRTIKNGMSGPSGGDSAIAGASVFGLFGVVPRVRGVLRLDYYDADVTITNAGDREFFGIAGIDFAPARDVSLIPNAEYTHRIYKNKISGSPTLPDDLVLRLTVAYAFSAAVP